MELIRPFADRIGNPINQSMIVTLYKDEAYKYENHVKTEELERISIQFLIRDMGWTSWNFKSIEERDKYYDFIIHDCCRTILIGTGE